MHTSSQSVGRASAPHFFLTVSGQVPLRRQFTSRQAVAELCRFEHARAGRRWIALDSPAVGNALTRLGFVDFLAVSTTPDVHRPPVARFRLEHVLPVGVSLNDMGEAGRQVPGQKVWRSIYGSNLRSLSRFD